MASDYPVILYTQESTKHAFLSLTHQLLLSSEPTYFCEDCS